MELASLVQRLSDDARRQAPGRFAHVLGVAHAAGALAERLGLDAGRAAIAGLIHDGSKSMSPEQIEADLEKRGAPIPDEDRPFPTLWHGLHAAATVRDECGLTDAEGAEEIAEAVRLHSTSDAGAGLLARVLFLADRLEPTRSFEGARELRLLARKDFEAAYRRALEAKIRHLETEGRAVSPRARRALSAVGDAR